MSRSFDLRELVRVAVVDERSGAEMYRTLAGLARDAALQDRFRRLAQQEKRHENRFEELLAGLGPPAEDWKYPDDWVDYVQALMAEGAAGEPSDRQAQAESVTDDLAAIDLAVQFERNQLNLQHEMGQMLGESDNPVVKEIIAEERAHLVELSAARRQLSGA
jgi:rubrerythrin